MKSTDLASLVLARLATLDGVDVMDGRVLKTPTRPYVLFAAGVGSRIQPRYSDRKARMRWTYAVMVVNNSPQGCRLLADRVRDLLDEWRASDDVYSVEDYIGPLIGDDRVEGDWRYSITLHMATHPPRRDA